MLKNEADAGGGRRVGSESILAVVPTLNEEDHIESTLRQLLSGSSDLAHVKIVVVDGGSTDQTRVVVAAFSRNHPNVSLLDNPDRLQAAGVNRAVELCAEPQHRILVRCDAHAHYPPNYILRVADSLMEHDVDALATVLDSTGQNCFQKGAAAAVSSRFGSGGSGHRGGTWSGYVDHGHHAGFLLDTWRNVGGYASDFATNEDAELDHRLTQAGGRIWLNADIRVGYVMRASLTGLARQYWRYGRGRARTVARHRMQPRLRQILPAFLTALLLLSVALAPLHPAFLVLPLAYIAVLALIAIGFSFNLRSVCGLWAGPTLAAVHLCWGGGFLWQMLLNVVLSQWPKSGRAH